MMLTGAKRKPQHWMEKWDFFSLGDIRNSFPLSGNPFFKNEKNN